MRKLVLFFGIMLMAISIVKAQPLTAAFTATTPLCQGTTVTFEGTFTGGTGTIIEWTWSVNGSQVGGTTSPTFSDFFPLGTTSAIINLHITDDGGHSSTMEQTVYFNEPPTATITIDPESENVCPGGTATMTVVCPTATGYLWSPGGATTNPLTVIPPIYTVYSVTVTDANGCTVLAQQDVGVHSPPTVSIPAVAPICSGASATLTTTTTLTTGYLWSPGGQTTSSITVQPTETTTYSVVVTSAQGCTATASRQVVVNPSPDLEISLSESEICEGEEVIATATGGDAYAWNPGGLSGAEQTLMPNQTITYSVTATIGGLCPQILDFTITVNPSYIIPETITICEGESILLGGAMQTEAGVYYDTYTTVHGCDSTIETTLVVNPAPTKYTLIGTGTYEYGGNGRHIYLSDSEPITSNQAYYSLYRGNLLMVDEIGTGSQIDFGLQLAGTYYCIAEYAETGCTSIMNNYVTIVEGTTAGTGKIASNVTYGLEDNEMLFNPNTVKVSLYIRTISVNEDTVIALISQQTLPANALVEFANLQPGDYYLKSQIINPATYPNVTPVCFYTDAFIVDSADLITIAANQVFTANIRHDVLMMSNGSNGVGGTVEYVGLGTKSNDPASDQVVILYDDVLDQIIAVDITDINGQYSFDNITDYGDFSLFLTSFQYQMWQPAEFTTTTDGSFEFNFTIDTIAGTAVQTGVNRIKLPDESFTIYPNPANENISIRTSQSDYEVSIYTLTGQQIIKERNSSTIDISDLAAGTYIILFKSGDMVNRRKLVVE